MILQALVHHEIGYITTRFPVAVARDRITCVDDCEIIARLGKRAANDDTRQARANHEEFLRGIAVFQEFTLLRAAHWVQRISLAFEDFFIMSAKEQETHTQND